MNIELIILILASTLALVLYIILVKNNNNNKENLVISKHFNRKKTDKILKQKSTKIRGNSKTPIYIIDNFLSDNDCDQIIQSAEGKMVNSPLTRYDPNDPNFRTSKTSYFQGIGNQDLIEQKICKEIQLSNDDSENSQIQHYRVGNHFKPHWDFFDPEIDKDFILDGGQRTWTFMVYLNNVEGGGSTKFIELNETIHPKKGTAVIWCNLQENGEPDKNTLHQGSNVEKGEKWIITKWFVK